MTLYQYYQLSGGNEKWVPTRVGTDLATLKPTFVTVLQLDTLLDEAPTREQIDSVKYQGPLYFDFDDEENVANSLTNAALLLDKLIAEGLEEQDADIFFSGKKGVHITVPPSCFMDKVQPLPKLPSIYKEIAFKFAVETLDFRVYSARQGRMWRTCFNQRENGKWRVPVTAAELRSATPESYAQLCSSPRLLPRSLGMFRAKFSLVFDAAKQKVGSFKRRRPKPMDAATLAKHRPIVAPILAGDSVADVGFNKIALQVALWGRENKLTADQLVAEASGLLEKHVSDGSRYNTRAKRERELRRMFFYIEDNAGYEYAIEPIRAMLGRTVRPDSPDFVGSDDVSPTSGGVIIRGDCYYSMSPDGEDRLIMAGVFFDPKPLLDPETGAIACLSCKLRTVVADGEKQIAAERGDFTSSAALHRLVASHGISFLGTDNHARGIYELMLRKVSESHFLVEAEGISYINIPSSTNPLLHEKFLVWADSSGVRYPTWVAETGTTFAFQGFPEAAGVMQTDLITAPPMKPYLEVEGNKDRIVEAFSSLLQSHSPDVISKVLGWMVACFWRQLFHAGYNKFPLLHINGQAGSGKTELVTGLMQLFYNKQEPKILTPASTPFAILCAVAGSASIPVIVDEYKPTEMHKDTHNKLKLVFRDAYNRRETARGGGNRVKENYNALTTAELSGPICFIAEAMESETALLERVILVTIKRQNPFRAARQYAVFRHFWDRKDVLPVIGHNLAAHVTKGYSFELFKQEFDSVYNKNREKFLLQPGDADKLSQEELASKAGGKERVVYNISVAEFGLIKLKALLRAVLGDQFDEKLGQLFSTVESSLFLRMEDINRGTIAEHLKVLIQMSDMSRIKGEHNSFRLAENEDYVLYEEGGAPRMALAHRNAYAKYMAYCRNLGSSPLYSNTDTFMHALQDSAYYLRRGKGLTNQVVETSILDYGQLLRVGMPPWAGKPNAMFKD